MSPSDWIQAGLTFALLVVAFMQWRTYNRQANIMEKQAAISRTQSDLQKKMAYTPHYKEIYDLLSEGLNDVVAKSSYTDKAENSFRQAKNKADLLNNEPIAKLSNKLLFDTIELGTIHSELKSLPIGDKRRAKAHQEGEILKSLAQQRRGLPSQFNPYLADEKA